MSRSTGMCESDNIYSKRSTRMCKYGNDSSHRAAMVFGQDAGNYNEPTMIGLDPIFIMEPKFIGFSNRKLPNVFWLTSDTYVDRSFFIIFIERESEPCR